MDAGSVNADSLRSVADHIIGTEDDSKDILENEISKGDIIYFGSGVHEADNISINTDNVVITGTWDSVLQLPSRDLEDMDVEWVLGVLDGTEGVVINGITVDFNRDAHTGTESLTHEAIEYDGDDGSIRNCQVLNSAGEGIDVDDATGVDVVGNTVDNCGGWGIHISENTIKNCIAYNHVRNCGHAHERGGIDQHSSSLGSNNYTGNTVEGCYIGYKWESVNATATGNVAFDNDYRSAVIIGSGHTVTGLVARGLTGPNSDVGIIVQNADNVSLGGAYLENIEATGVNVLSDCSGVTVSGVVVDGLIEQHGIKVGGNNCSVSGCVVDNVDRGIWNTGKNGAVTGNTVSNADDIGIYVATASANRLWATVGDNSITGVSGAGIRLFNAQACTVVSNTVEGSTGNPIEETSDANDNMINSNVVDGLISTTGAATQTPNNIEL